MKSKTLFEIGEDLNALYELLTDTDGDVSDEESEAAIEAWFAEIESDRNKKIDGYCRLISNLDYFIEARKAEIDRLSKSSKVLKNKHDRLKERLLLFMNVNNLDKITTDLYTVSAVKNGGKEPLRYPELWDSDPAAAPENYHRRLITVDFEAIRYDLEDGKDVDGCYIEPRGKHIRIK